MSRRVESELLIYDNLANHYLEPRTPLMIATGLAPATAYPNGRGGLLVGVPAFASYRTFALPR